MRSWKLRGERLSRPSTALLIGVVLAVAPRIDKHPLRNALGRHFGVTQDLFSAVSQVGIEPVVPRDAE
jgi:hypothetical protein